MEYPLTNSCSSQDRVPEDLLVGATGMAGELTEPVMNAVRCHLVLEVARHWLRRPVTSVEAAFSAQ